VLEASTGTILIGGLALKEEAQVLREELERKAREWGASLFGVADLSSAKAYIEEVFGDELLHLDRAVVMAVPYPAAVVNQLQAGPTHTYLHYYKIINSRLDDLALRIALLLQDEGYEAFPVPASQRVTEDKLAGIFSHRLAASLAGLGWIGKNSALINPTYGPRLRLVTVLTDAPLPADKPIKERCGRCTACVEACPASAITGKAFHPADPLEERLHAGECDKYLSKVRVSFGKRVCGRCLAACPWGMKTRKRR
jgi:epoxyqueuosine reductase QueG